MPEFISIGECMIELSSAGDDLWRQFPLGGHFQRLVAEGLDQQALAGLAGDDGGSRRSTGEQGRAAVETKFSLDLGAGR